MSELIDSVVKSVRTCVDGKWYIAKCQGSYPIRRRLGWALDVLMGNAIAVHYKEEEPGAVVEGQKNPECIIFALERQIDTLEI